MKTAIRAVTKRLPVVYAKALTSADVPGTFEAVVATFGNADPVGDVVEAGAFLASIGEGLAPVVWTHDWMTPPIGVTLEMGELTLAEVKALVPTGLPSDVTGALYGKARLLVNVEDGEDVPVARQVYAGMIAKGGDGRAALREFSWSGAILSETIELADGQPPEYHLNEIDLYEWGPCLKGMNPETALLAVKSAIDHGEMEPARARKLLGFPTSQKADTEASTDAPQADAPEVDTSTSEAVVPESSETDTTQDAPVEASVEDETPPAVPVTPEQRAAIADLLLI